MSSTISPGRPPLTSAAAIEKAALELFTQQGFDATTTDDLAEVVGIGRRTLFRYFPSKFDIPWGDFDSSLAFFEETLHRMPADLPVWRAVQESVVRFNTFDSAQISQHRMRMKLILRTPSLQAHSVLMYQKWREVIARYVGERLNQDPDSLLPRTIGHVSLALAISSYEEWLDNPDSQLELLLSESLQCLIGYLGV